MEHNSGYAALDLLLTYFFRDNPDMSKLEWELMSEEKLKKINAPSKDFNKKVVAAYSVYTGESNVKEENADIFYVFGKYIRKDFYSKNKFDEKEDYFFTLYAVGKNESHSFSPAKFVINQREYKSWLIDMLEIGERYKTSLAVKEQSSKIQQVFTKADEIYKNNFKSKDFDENETDIENLF